MLERVYQAEFRSINRGYDSIFYPARLSIGLVAPLEAYPGAPVPSMKRHLERVQLAEELGFAAVWLRDVPFNVPSFGDAGQLYDSIHGKLFSLPGGTIVYPGHDYAGLHATTIAEEKVHNPRLGNNRSRQDFVDLMNALQLDPPAQIAEAVPGNLQCGLKQG